ncbi:MAG TPA: TrkH family potassium uptake protein [Bacteroidales bacterium]|jgi:trk system potassium uptake protein TrkH|nr:TrkH family potassium uptake protein [Bacteroidales bacterium]
MINFRIIARVFSLLLIVEGIMMLLSSGVSYIYAEHATRPLFYSALVTLISGAIVFTPVKKIEKVTGKKEGYIVVAGGWILFAVFGSLPYLFSHSVQTFTDAFFESLSGFTTTGATIFADVESLDHGILFWRSMTQWAGGAAIIFISLYVLPVFRSVYLQLPAADFSGQPSDKIHPRVRDVALRLLLIYAGLTLAETLLLSFGGISFFDSLCLSFSTFSTGGFSTMNNSLTSFSGSFVTVVITICMFLAGINMTFIYFGLKGNYKKILGSNEFIFYVLICAVFSILVAMNLIISTDLPFGKSIVNGAFHVVSLVTTTGFYIKNPLVWSELLLILFFLLMFTGGTTGSASSGIKSVRLLLVTRNSGFELIRLIHPNAFIPVRLDRKIIPSATLFNLLVYITLYFLVICASAMIISLMGYDIITSFSTSASMLANIGPGLGSTGPFTGFADMPFYGKWFMAGLMLMGRLELFTVMVLFTKNFYRR